MTDITEIERRANEEVRHGNREALEQMTDLVECVVGADRRDTESRYSPDGDAAVVISADVWDELVDDCRAASFAESGTNVPTGYIEIGPGQ